jgi:hypothetical protein
LPQFESVLNQVFFDHWSNLRHGGALPTAESYFDRIDPRLAPLIIVFECAATDVIIRFQGTQVVGRWRADRTGQSWLETKPEPKRPIVFANMRDCAGQPCGVWAKSSAVTRSGRSARQENLTLPLAVQRGRPPRLVLLSSVLEGNSTPDDPYDHTAKGSISWFDVGFGVPNHPLRRSA